MAVRQDKRQKICIFFRGGKEGQIVLPEVLDSQIRTMPPIAKFPEVYGVCLGAFLGWVNSWIIFWLADLKSTNTTSYLTSELACGGAFFGLFFGVGVRLIYLLSHRRIPYGFVTLVALGICLPLYLVVRLVNRADLFDLTLGTAAASSGIVLFVLVLVESWRTKPPVAKVPEVYGFFIGAFLGVVDTIVCIWFRDLFRADFAVEEGVELITAVMMATGGAVFGLLFGFGLRTIYRMNRREVPFGLVTLVTLGICIPLYVVSTFQAMVEKTFDLSFYSTLASPFIVLLVLAALEWWRARKQARIVAVRTEA